MDKILTQAGLKEFPVGEPIFKKKLFERHDGELTFILLTFISSEFTSYFPIMS